MVTKDKQGVLIAMKQFIDELQAGDRVQDFFLVVEKRMATTRNGKPYLDVILQDKSGRIACKIWENAAEENEKFSSGNILKILGTVSEFKNQLQISIEKLRLATDSDDYCKSDFYPSSKSDLDEMFGKILSVINSIENVYLKKLLENIFGNDKFADSFKNSPAAKSIHHTYLGGLLEHTLSIVEICSFLSSHYGDVDRDVLLTGAILHDCGKIYELHNFDYSTEGQLIGHISIGSMVVDRESRKIDDFPEKLRMEIIHLILSHQGEKEWGSPVVPMTREAILLHHADNLDAKFKICSQALEKDADIEGDFTSRVHSMGRSFYKGKKG